MSQLLDGLHILVLEDEVLIAMDVEQLCRDHGASEVTVLRSLAGMDMDNPSIQFDAAIVDLMLGGVSTLDFAKILFDRKKPFVFASGYSDMAEIESAFPGVMMVAKPYSGLDLVQALAASCGRSMDRPEDQLAGDPIT